jgi:cellulose synthase operon protein C
VRISDRIVQILGRVELTLAGAEGAYREAEEALALGDPRRARAAAHRLLAKVPGSPVGLALLADACEAAELQAELLETLEELVPKLSGAADLWLRLATAREHASCAPDEVRQALVSGLRASAPGSSERREILLRLIDFDLDRGEHLQAELWLDRLGDDRPLDVRLRRAEARYQRGLYTESLTLLRDGDYPPSDGRAALALGRAMLRVEGSAGYAFLIRAYLLEAKQSSEVLRRAVQQFPPDAVTLARILDVARARGEENHLDFRLADLIQSGQVGQALRILLQASDLGDPSAQERLLELALRERNLDALRAALAGLDQAGVAADKAASAGREEPGDTRSAEQLEAEKSGRAILAHVDAKDVRSLRSVLRGDAGAWCNDLLRAHLATLIARPTRTRELAESSARERTDPTSHVDWTALLDLLAEHARRHLDVVQLTALEAVARERERPLRIAILGEFNAGKSSFINAILGADVAPTGILPTTGTLHYLRFGPHRAARILRADKREVLVPSSELRAALANESDVEYVEIFEPLPMLMGIELLDTPGFNAPDPRHTAAAKRAFQEADAAIWILDAGQPLKDSERTRLAELGSLPLQIVIGKADRLKPGELEKVMAMVEQAVAEVGRSDEQGSAKIAVATLGPPIAFSARLALQGKQGDANAAERSNWPAIETMLHTTFENHRVAMKDRSLLHRLLPIVTELHGRLQTERKTWLEQRAESHSKLSVVSQLLTRIETESDTLAVDLQASLKGAQEKLAQDLAALDLSTPSPNAYAEQVLGRAQARMGPTLVHAARGLGVPMTSDALAEVLDDVIASYIYGLLAQSPRLDPARGVSRLAEAVLRRLGKELRRERAGFEYGASDPYEGLARELGSLAAHLHARLGTPHFD